jgi:hypothetical protein
MNKHSAWEKRIMCTENMPIVPMLKKRALSLRKTSIRGLSTELSLRLKI